MQTVAVSLEPDAWSEILNGNNALAVQIRSAGGIHLHFNDSADAPASDAPFVLVDSFPPRWDFECNTQVGQARVWARSARGNSNIIVVRRTQ